MDTNLILAKSEKLIPLTKEEAIHIYKNCSTEVLASVANRIREKIKKGNSLVTWQIDRNVNITNVCVSGCLFCNFHCKPHEHDKEKTTTLEEYREKIKETLELGGDQLLLQGGMHPKFDIFYYENLFRQLKAEFPNIKLHALGPPEVSHIAKISNLTSIEVLKRLINAGLDSFPGAGAEILVSDIRKKVSPNKCTAEQWIEIMHEAHELGLATSATMMYGHIESLEDRIEHLIKIRELQARKPKGSYGFLAFIPWVYCGKGTALEAKGIKENHSIIDYIRIIAMSRIVLTNIENIQASWLTLGKEAGQLSLHAGANDLGSIMIEENVVSSAGASFKMGVEEMQQTIRDAGFTPQLRDQKYNFRD
ncbi:MAG: CofH family radical SAM protein [Bacteroidetes bacterium]|nr:CofH family radical SAM protein [Bacteroidota bacterium]